MKTFAKCLIIAGLVATTTGFTHATVFDVNDPARGLHRMHHELVVDP